MIRQKLAPKRGGASRRLSSLCVDLAKRERDMAEVPRCPPPYGNHILIDTAGQEIAHSVATLMRLVSEQLD